MEQRFNIKNPYWYEDLPDRETEIQKLEEIVPLREDLNEVNDKFLEISRASSLLRGGLVFIASAVLVVTIYYLPGLAIHSFDSAVPRFLTFIFWVSVISLYGFGFFAIWLDCHIPRDLPVRFYRQVGKVVIYDYSLSLNPFARRRVVVKTYDWNTIQAELSKQAGYNGKAYMIRYGLVLVICKPGTNEVIERITLKGNNITTRDLQAMWAYIRCYMGEGREKLPIENPRPKEINLRRSFFTYMPYFDPSEEGSEYRSRMGAFDVLFAFVMMWFFWIWLPIGLCHYIAMKCAPEPEWPSDISRL